MHYSSNEIQRYTYTILIVVEKGGYFSLLMLKWMMSKKGGKDPGERDCYCSGSTNWELNITQWIQFTNTGDSK